MWYFLSFPYQNPQVGLEPTMAPHPVSLASVLISKSTWGVLIIFLAFGIVPNHHFKSSMACLFKLNIFASSFLHFSFSKEIFFSRARLFSWCSFPNGIARKMEMTDLTTNANFQIVGNGFFKNFLTFNKICSAFSLLIWIVYEPQL